MTAELLRVDEVARETHQDLELETGANGNGLLALGQVEPGAYVLRARASFEGEAVGVAEEPIIVEAADVELQSPFPRPATLRTLAEASGGEFVEIDDDLPEVEIKDTRRVEVDRTRRVPVWDTLPVFVLFLLVVGTEWWLRRRGGLL